MKSSKGFTLIEIVIVIVITGIIASVVSVFVLNIIKQYSAINVRVQMVDESENALRLMSREIRGALPNSVRVSADGLRIEFIPTVTGARYRQEISSGGSENILDFSTVDTSFEIYGAGSGITGTQQWIAIYNLGPGITGSDAYQPISTLAEQTLSNRRQLTSISGNVLTISSLAAIPDINKVSPHRLFIIGQPIMYVCNTSTGLLTRHVNYGFQTAIPSASGTSSILASNISSCNFTYDANVIAQRSGLVVFRTQMTKTTNEQAESIVLNHSIHVNNLP